MNLLVLRARRAAVLANKKVLEYLRSPQAATVTDMPWSTNRFGELAAHKHGLVVTYRKDGRPVAQPVWPGFDGDRIYLWTEEQAMKAKRLRRNPNALIAPCTFRGKPLGNPIAVTGRILDDPAEREHAAAILRAQWSRNRRAYAALSRPLTDVVYIELTPRRASAAGYATPSASANGAPV